MISQLFLILFIILIIFYVLIKLISKRNQWFQSSRSVQTLGGVTLGQNKSMQVVEVGHRLFIVGVAENVTLLDKIEDQEEIAFIKERMIPQTNMKLPDVRAWARAFRNKPDTTWEEEVEATASFQQVFHDKMQRISNRKQGVEQLIQDDFTKERLD